MKKIFSIILISFLLLQNISFLKVYADEITDTPTPTPTITTDTPTPTPDNTQTVSATPTPAPTPEVTIDTTNTATVTNNATSSANTGDNSIDIATPSAEESTPSGEEATPTPTPDTQTDNTTQITTGNSVSETTATNTINTTTQNSQVVYQTINVFVDQNGNLDLSNPAALAEQIISQDPSNNPSYNVKVTDVNNTAILSNQVTTTADTGNNATAGDNQVIINTGNAYAITSLMNTLNVTLIDSTVHVVTLNIYGNLTGNILLPNISNTSDSTQSANIDSTVSNNATVTNELSGTADSGNNSVTASDSSTITTGNATSIVQATTIANTNFWSAFFGNIFINLFGTWNGNFLGWGTLPSQNGGQSLSLSGNQTSTDLPCSQCSLGITATNAANLTNTITSSANTGNNSLSGQSGTIHTGNAYSVISLTNLVNSNFINSKGFFGFINIFGNVTGDIGQANLFPASNAATVTPTLTPAPQQASSSSDSKEDGGQLWIDQTNNVDAYVLPGDTVTFFVKVKNPGTGRVYNSDIQLTLFHDGQNVGGAQFHVGDIDAQKGVKLTTGIVLSENSPAGSYSAVATVTGTTGNENNALSASDTSYFQLAPSFISQQNILQPHVISAPQQIKKVLGTTQKTSHSNNPLWVLLGVVIAYILSRLLTSKDQLAIIMSKQTGIKKKLLSLKLFLF